MSKDKIYYKGREMIFAPIVIPTMCRSDKFIRLIESLKRNSWAKYTDVYVGVDYPSSEKYIQGWKEINEYIDNGDFSAFADFIVYKRTENIHPRNEGLIVQELEKKTDRYIRTDDDCEFSPNFLEYMDKCLMEYEDDDSVIAVSGYSYPCEWKVSEGATCFKENFTFGTWGTGLWFSKKKKCRDIIYSGAMFDKIEEVMSSKRYQRMLDIAQYQYFRLAIFKEERKGSMMHLTDCALRAFCAVYDLYSIYPVISKSRNHGWDGTGEYCGNIIVSDKKSICAQNYDYSQQPIDTERSFAVIENSLDNMPENYQLLNNFDTASFSCVVKNKIFINLYGILGNKTIILYHFLQQAKRKCIKLF